MLFCISLENKKRSFGSTKRLFPDRGKKYLFRSCRCGIKIAKEKLPSFFRSSHCLKCFFSPAFERCCHLFRFRCGHNRNGECRCMEQRLMPPGVNSCDIPLYLLLKAPFRRREITVDLKMEKILPRLRLLVPGLG